MSKTNHEVRALVARLCAECQSSIQIAMAVTSTLNYPMTDGAVRALVKRMKRIKLQRPPNEKISAIHDLVTRLWTAGYSYGRIADELSKFLGRPVKRGVVAGHVHRLKLPRRGRTLSSERRQRSRGADHKPRRRREHLPPMSLPIVEDLEIPAHQRRTIWELKETTCRFPVGNPRRADFFYCGGKPLKGFPYCGYHARICYRPATARNQLVQRAAA